MADDSVLLAVWEKQNAWDNELTLDMVRKATIACLFALFVWFVPRSAVAQRATAATPDAPLADSLDRLSRRRYSSRQEATLEMWRKRELSRDQVQEAARHPDPEVSGRAKWILRQWRRGSLPDTPPEISRLLRRSDGPAAIERLLEGGQFNAAVVAVEESAGTIEREAIQKRLSSALLRRFPVYAHHALTSESLLDLLRLIDLVADTKELAVCRIQLMQQIGIAIGADSLLPSSAATWSLIQRQRASALVLMILGRIDEAIEVAGESVDKDLLHQCRMMASRWSDAARDSLRSARQTEPGSYEHARLWCLTLIAADRARDDALFLEASKELSSVEVAEDNLATELRWKCLASHGEVDAAFEILDQVSPDLSASVSIGASRTGRAFDVLGYPLDRVDTEIQQWVDQAIAAQRDDTSEDLTPATGRIMALIQCLLAVGRDDAAWYIADRLCRSDVKIDTLRLREYVIFMLTMTKRSDWVVQLAVGDGAKSLSANSMQTISRTLSHADGNTFEIVMESLATIMRGKPLEQRVRAAHQLFMGEIPGGFDPEVDFRRLYEFITGPRRTRQLGGAVAGQDILANLNLVQLFALHGQSDLASDCLQKLVQTGDVKAMFYLAEQELDGGRAETAMTQFQAVINAVANQGRSSRRLGSVEDVAIAVKALVGAWTVARRSGDAQLSAELEREIRIALCTPSTRLRNTVTEYLGERGESLLAMETYESLLPMAVFGNPENTGLYDVARGYSLIARKTNAAEAARWFDLAVGGTLDSMNFLPGAYITLPLYVRRWNLESAIQLEDQQDARRHLNRILKLDPLDIDFAERLLPQMRKAGMDDLADEALDRIIDRGQKYAERFPFDAMTCNNLAWVAAMNQRRLDDALRLSQLAVYVEPDSAIYRDTLAEVLFLLDRKQEALQVEQGCLLDDPSQWHLHEQIRKYSEAIESDDA